MSTRSLTVIHDVNQDKEVCVLYRHCDGYPSGHGAELKAFLDGFSVTNGIRDRGGKSANGAGCLAAQMVKHFKDGVGQFYIYAAGTRDVWEDYIYVVRVKDYAPIELEVIGDKTLYKGPVSGFNPEMDEAA
jgi:hypothetical protein